MAFMDLMGRFMLPIRIVQLVFSVIVLALTAFAATWNWGGWGSSRTNFMLFTSIWSVLALIYLVISTRRYPGYAHKFAILAVEGLTMLFWFAAWVALADFLGSTGFRGNGLGRWAALTAATVFAAFTWILFVITSAMATIHVFRTRGSRGTAHEGPAPEMGAHQSA